MKKLLYITLAISMLTIGSAAEAAGLKKVLILDFINREKKPAFQYVESSITNAVQNMLKEKFAYKETAKAAWQTVAEENYLYRKDYYTQSVATNIGLLTKQDVVIAGGYRIEDARAGARIITHVYIIDVSKKQLITEFDVVGPAGNMLFDSIEKLSLRIEKEIQAVLPNKADWKRLQLDDSDSAGITVFNNAALGLRAGGYLFYQGYESYFKPEQPTLGLMLRANVPLIWDRLAIQTGIYYMKHTLKEGNGSQVQSLGLQGITTTYFFTGFLMIDIALSNSFSISPKLGGGYTYQTTSVSGEQSDSLINYFPFAAAGLEFSYKINKAIALVLDAQVFLEYEEKQTYIGNVNLGVNYYF